MQINFENANRSVNSPGFWNWVSLDSVLRSVENPSCYTPYGTPGYWEGFPGNSSYQNSDIINAAFGDPTNTSPVPPVFNTFPTITPDVLVPSTTIVQQTTNMPSVAPNSGQGTTVATSALAGLSADAPAAANPDQSIATALPIGPVSLVSPLPSITPPRPDQVTGADPCPISNWIANNPAVAALSAIGIFLLFAGGKK